MLEVNNFSAIRISLASPDQIREWSKGEVTKPETINYRTLKPEKDGLFDERIFGPTRDWECYCGKYKRIRYKGIICDKCGVEVTRSKVRRERMGHIQLASPVSHIWYFKGTPSRLGILLDISPRNLERILYFALYIVTHVDEEARQRALKALDEQSEGRGGAGGERLAELEGTLKADVHRKRDELRASLEATRVELEAQRTSRTEEVVREAQAVEAALKELKTGVTEETIAFVPTGEVVVAAGDKGGKEATARLRKIVAAETERVTAELKQRELDEERGTEQKVQDLVAAMDESLRAERESLASEAQGQKEELRQARAEIEALKALMTIGETEFRQLDEKYGSGARTGRIFWAGMGAEAVRDIIVRMDLEELSRSLHAEVRTSSGQRRKKAIKRLRLIEAFRRSGNRPEWMILSVLPVIPPDLRPMVQLDGGRFATSDLNDLYRRVINRNNRLKRLLELGAPEIIIRNEKRMLQEACDALIDNGRRGRAIAGTGNHRLKSLSDMLKGKQGRFRQNLLGKRVDYSGRSVIVVGPELKLHQCGLPKKMALELFKPFVMRQLVEKGFAHNIKSAKRIVERVRPEVWDVLEEVIKDHPVLLNRAPTLHRLGIQAFMPVLVEGSAIQIHPLVCTAFNADFDGDQMAVHVPLSTAAQEEARAMMLSTANLLSPADGSPVVAPTQDMVLGCYYLTMDGPAMPKGSPVRSFTSEDDAIIAYELGARGIDTFSRKLSVPEDGDGEGNGTGSAVRHAGASVLLHEPVDVVVRGWDADSATLVDQRARTTVGRILFNRIVPQELRYRNDPMKRADLKRLVDECYRVLGPIETAHLVDGIKSVGFEFATRGGMTIGLWDIVVPKTKRDLLTGADDAVGAIDRQFQRGLITEDERYEQVVELWQRTTKEVADSMMTGLPDDNALRMMTDSGARGNKGNIGQLGAMRGLMADPSGRIIDVPVRSNFREGMTVLEYFISTHGARKGLADTALRTADSGYLTRRLVDVAQDVITREDDCGTEEGSWIIRSESADEPEAFQRRLVGRLAAADLVDPGAKVKKGETAPVVVARNDMVTEELARAIDAAGIDEVLVRSPLACESRYGVCRMCYGRNLATGEMIGIGEAVGIIAAQSIGEPGTQLTMRTFHTGGVAGQDITQGLPRVEELFEARIPKGKAEISHIDGIVEVIASDAGRKVKVTSREAFDTPILLPDDAELLAAPGDLVEGSQVLARSASAGDVTAPVKGFLARTDDGVVVRAEDVVEREYAIPHSAKLLVDDGTEIRAGDAITDGPINPQEYLDTRGKDAVQRYLVKEVQRVYRSQGVTINDKHIEIIVRQMLKKVRIDQPGDCEQLPTELVDRLDFEEANNRVLAEGGEPATAQTVLLGVTKASLNTSSFLAAASFQETTRVLTEAAINGAKDHLIGLKENVIIGKLIPAGTGAPQNIAAIKERQRRAALEALAGEALEGLGEAEYNPFLEDGTRVPDEETAGLALAATIAGAEEDETDLNPFLADAGDEAPEEEETPEFNPFLADASEEG
ncbi:MAG: DNA-directed RNA polymerase subunit beta' [Chloroflexi bacterium RBG_16_69_14]|nr:MAG: DNA-directed RNA polymerase subunit beta' [Chloroflexi bacterium RBG_16_69_14]